MRLISPHQRCDGKRPCATCLNVREGAECTYESWLPSGRASTKVLSVSCDGAPRLLSADTLSLQTSAVGFSFSEYLARPPPDIPLVSWSDSNEPGPSLPPPLAHCERPLTPTAQLPWGPPPRAHGEIGPGPPSDVSVLRNIHDTTERVPHHTASSFTVLPYIHSRTIPRPLPVPLSLIPPERVQISPVAGADLDMTLCVFIFRFWIFTGCGD